MGDNIENSPEEINNTESTDISTDKQKFLDYEGLQALVEKINENVGGIDKDALDSKVNKAGDIMTGDLVLKRETGNNSIQVKEADENGNIGAAISFQDGEIYLVPGAYKGINFVYTMMMSDGTDDFLSHITSTLIDENGNLNAGLIRDPVWKATNDGTGTNIAIQFSDIQTKITELEEKSASKELNVDTLYFGNSNSIYLKRTGDGSIRLDNPIISTDSGLDICFYSGEKNGWIHPTVNNGVTLGSSDKYFKGVYGTDIYATTFHGTLQGNATTADTATKATQDSSGSNINTRFTTLEARPTIYSSTSAPSSSSGKNGDLWVVYN